MRSSHDCDSVVSAPLLDSCELGIISRPNSTCKLLNLVNALLTLLLGLYAYFVIPLR